VVYSDYVKQRALAHYSSGKRPPIIQVLLRIHGNMQTEQEIQAYQIRWKEARVRSSIEGGRRSLTCD
jgi:hypothetical protein